jgi:cell division protein FtsB
MSEQKLQFDKTTPSEEPLSKRERAVALARRAWRQVGTGVAVLLAAMLMWHVINGKHGLSVWHQNHTQDRELQRQINEIQQDNAQLRKQIDRLKSDPDAIEHEAREKLHYAKPGEVIYSLPDVPQIQPPVQPQSAK